MTYERALLCDTAYDILAADLIARGNVLSRRHEAALYMLVDTLARHAVGEGGGRLAFPLPTGCGKTSSIVAFATALHRLGYPIPIAIAASKVEALAGLKLDMMAHGIPEELIGLAYSDSIPAQLPSTGNRPEDGRLIQLVTHAKVRMNEKHLGLFAEFRGANRPLLIYDESLWRSEVFSFPAVDVESALGALIPHVRSKVEYQGLVEFLQTSVDIINGALSKAQAGKNDHNKGIPIQLPDVHAEVIALWKQAIATSPLYQPQRDAVANLLEVSQQSLQVISISQGGGAISVRPAVSDQMENIIVLDASAPIRDLVSIDSSIELAFPMSSDIKSYENVEVIQIQANGGRSSIEQTFSVARKETSMLSKEVLEVVKKELQVDTQRCILLVNFKKSRRSELDITERLKADLSAAGYDPEETLLLDGVSRPRFTFLTWGMHEALNGFEFCKTVILCGVLHRANLDIAAAIRGQAADVTTATPHSLIDKVVRSEIGHCVMQAASRGSCRRINNGKAAAMRLYFILPDAGLKALLEPVMPKVRWSYQDPVYLKKAAPDRVMLTIRARILEALAKLPPGVSKISSTRLKKLMTFEDSEAAKRSFSNAVESLNLDNHAWRSEGRSLVRDSAAFGFKAI
jgi:hypothetical protein